MCLIIINKLINNIIIMNEIMSLLTAATVLGLGSLGLYIFKSSDDENQEDGQEYNESNMEMYPNDNEIIEQNEFNDSLRYENDNNLKRRSKIKSQTKRQKKMTGTKRRY